MPTNTLPALPALSAKAQQNACYWVTPAGEQFYKLGYNTHHEILKEIPDNAFYLASGEYCAHLKAFKVGFLRATITTTGDFFAQWSGLLTPAQRAAVVNLSSNCLRLELSSASQGFDPEGARATLSLCKSDSRFKRLLGARLRSRMKEWTEN